MVSIVSSLPKTTMLMLVSLIFSFPVLAGHLDIIQNNHELKICYWPDYFGISYRNPKTLELSGIDIDMGRALAADLHVSPRFVESSFPDLVADLNHDRCDIAMFAIGVTQDRIEKIRFSSPYIQSDIYAIASKTNPRIKKWSDIDQNDTIVAVAKGTLHEQVMRAKLKKASLLVLDTPFAREQEVQSGRADVFMTDYPYSRRFLANTDWGKLIAPDGIFHVTPYAYAMKKGDDAWYQRVQSFVSDIKKDGRLMQAATKQHLESIVVQ